MLKNNTFTFWYKRNTDISIIINEIETALCLKELSIQKDLRGRPSLCQQSIEVGGLSLSHTDDTTVCIVTTGKNPIGIDTQYLIKKKRTIYNFLSQEEVKVISEKNLFLEATICWTFKEAFVKALGTGFTVHPKNICCANILHTIEGDEGEVLYEKQKYRVKILTRNFIRETVTNSLVILKK